MAGVAVWFVLKKLGEEGTSQTGVENELKDIKDELQSIQAFLKDADRRAEDEEGGANEGIKTWVKQLREASFHIEDVVDEYIMYSAQRVDNFGCVALLQNIAFEIQDIKLSVHGIKERRVWYQFESDNGPGSSKRTIEDALFIEENQIVGFESQRDELVSCLVEGTSERMLISVVGMGGLGKTTLANHVFDNQLVKKHFDCRCFITVSQTYTVRELLIDMIQKFCKDSNEPIPKGLQKMDGTTLITHLRQYLRSKRYLVLFDDVWKEDFSDEIEHAMTDNNRGSRIIVTTRMVHVAEYFKKSFPVHVHNLQPLSPNKAWELFCKKTFRSEPGGQCPKELEEVAEEYLTHLIHRSLIQVSKVGFDGKIKSCRVHDLLREVIIRKMKDLCFCHLVHEDDEQVMVGITRRFSIAASSNNVLRSDSSYSGIRAIFVFDKGELPEDFLSKLSAKFKLLKVLDFENSLLNYVPDNLGNLFHLRYLNLSHTKVEVLPRSIGELLNLETLDLRQTKVHVLPSEINKLTKLRLLPVYYRKYEGHYSMLNFTIGVQMQKGIGCLKSLQKLYFLEADHGGIGLIQELKMLRQLRKLGIRRVRREYGNVLCDAIKEMNHLESLNITAISEDEILDLDFIEPPQLRVLNLKGRLSKLPDWIPKLEYLVKLRLGLSNFEGDPLDSLKNLPNLLRLNMWDDAFAGESLHFQVGGFPKLKELDLTRLNRLSSIFIDKGALLSLDHLKFNNNPQLKVVPQDLQYLENLQFLGFADMPAELVESIDPDKGGPCHWIIKHIPLVLIRQKVGPRFHDYELRPIPTLSHV